MTDPRGGLVVTVMSGFDSYQMNLLHGMQQALTPLGIGLLAHVHYDRTSHIQDSLACLIAHMKPLGVVATSPQTPGQEEEFRSLLGASDLPVVNIAQVIPGQSYIRTDNIGAMTALMTHLLDERGARRPVFVQGCTEQPDHVDRETVFRRELARRGLPFDERFLLPSSGDRDTAFALLSQLLQEHRDFDAIVTTDDWIAISALNAIKGAGLTVPDDVMVTGFDNYPIASLTWPGVTTVDQNLKGQGDAAITLLMEELAGAPPRGEVIVPASVVVRASTGGTSDAHRADLITGDDVARLAQVHLADQGAMLRLSRSLLECRTVEDTCEVLAANFPALGIRRCFLVVYEDGEDASTTAEVPGLPGGVVHHTCRLALDYREGRAHPVPTDSFSSCGYLPRHLQGELTDGYLGYQGILTSRGKLGYILLDHDFGSMNIVEPLRLDIGRAIVAALDHRQLTAHSAELERLVARRTHELEQEVAVRREAEQRLQRLLTLDGLTQIPNKTAMQCHLAEQWDLHVRAQAEMAVLMIDVDMFKAYNDHYGHLLGDEALRTIAQCLEQSMRYPDDLACRFGGEEFTVLLPRTGLDGALTVAERFRALLARAAVPHAASPTAPVVTASIGIAVARPAAGLDPKLLIAEADQALYVAKGRGRNTFAVSRLTTQESPQAATGTA